MYITTIYESQTHSKYKKRASRHILFQLAYSCMFLAPAAGNYNTSG